MGEAKGKGPPSCQYNKERRGTLPLLTRQLGQGWD